MVSGNHSIFTHFPKDRNCVMRTKITRASRRRRIGTVVSRGEKFGDLISADHKVLSEGCELQTIIDTLLWHKTWQQSGYNRTHAQNKNFPRNAEELAKNLGADEETKSHLR